MYEKTKTTIAATTTATVNGIKSNQIPTRYHSWNQQSYTFKSILNRKESQFDTILHTEDRMKENKEKCSSTKSAAH